MSYFVLCFGFGCLLSWFGRCWRGESPSNEYISSQATFIPCYQLSNTTLICQHNQYHGTHSRSFNPLVLFVLLFHMKCVPTRNNNLLQASEALLKSNFKIRPV